MWSKTTNAVQASKRREEPLLLVVYVACTLGDSYKTNISYAFSVPRDLLYWVIFFGVFEPEGARASG